MQIEVPLATDQFGGAEFALLKLIAHPGGHLQPAGDAAFRTDGQRDGLTVRTKSHRLGVISHGRMRFELTPLIRVARVNGADLGNRVDHVLGGKIRFFSDQAISGVMDVIFAMQILLKGEFGKSVAGAIELFHSGFEFLAVASCQDQFSLYRQVNIHLFNIQYGTSVLPETSVLYAKGAAHSSPPKTKRLWVEYPAQRKMKRPAL